MQQTHSLPRIRQLLDDREVVAQCAGVLIGTDSECHPPVEPEHLQVVRGHRIGLPQ